MCPRLFHALYNNSGSTLMKDFIADYHTHTKYCDGKDTPERMAELAYEKGFSVLGFSGHGYTAFDGSYCMSLEGTKAYLSDIAALKEKYRGKMTVLAGIEADMNAPMPEGDFDYVIGSSHYVPLGGKYYPIDCNKEDFKRLVDEGFGGDYEALCEVYFKELESLPDKIPCDIIGHFDLVTKYAEIYDLKRGERYYKAAYAALDKLLARGIPFEVNVGAITRGYRTVPYPEECFLRYIKERGGEIFVTGDCHSAENLCKNLDTGIDYAKKCGFTHRLVITRGSKHRCAI